MNIKSQSQVLFWEAAARRVFILKNTRGSTERTESNLKGRDYDGIHWGLRRQNFDDYDAGGESPLEAQEDIKPKSEEKAAPKIPSFDPLKFFGLNNQKPEPEPPIPSREERSLGSQIWGQALRLGSRGSFWTVKQSWKAVSPALQRGFEAVPGWGPQYETKTDEELEKSLVELEVLQTRLERRLQRAHQQIEEIAAELARRQPPRRASQPAQDFSAAPDSNNTDGSML